MGSLLKMSRSEGVLLISMLAALLSSSCAFPASAAGQQQGGNPPAQAGAGLQAAEPKFRVVRSQSGSKGTEQGGRFVVEDPRSVFYLPEDKEIIVYFEWEGPPGLHQFEGLWKNPEGKIVAVSDFKYEAMQQRFAGYWKLLLTEALPTGVWALEARIDGESAGAHTFQILAAARPISAAPSRRALTPAEIYQQALAASVFIEKFSAAGERVRVGSGFFVGGGLVLTAFQVIDGANLLRLVLPDGRRVETNQVLTWNRRQDWALLGVEPTATARLSFAKPGSWAVGDRCFSLDSPAEGNRTIVECGVIGQNDFPQAGARFNLSFSPSQQAIGGPVLNEYGELIGVVGGSLLPGASAYEETHFGYPPNVLAVPISLVSLPPDDRRPTSLDELARNGQFIPLLVGQRNVMRATLALGVDRTWNSPRPIEEKSEFSRREGKMVVFLAWYPKQKRKGLASVRVYNLDNKLLFESKPLKINLQLNQFLYTTWDITFGNMSPTIYRIDVYLDADPIWRTFFRMTE